MQPGIPGYHKTIPSLIVKQYGNELKDVRVQDIIHQRTLTRVRKATDYSPSFWRAPLRPNYKRKM